VLFANDVWYRSRSQRYRVAVSRFLLDPSNATCVTNVSIVHPNVLSSGVRKTRRIHAVAPSLPHRCEHVMRDGDEWQAAKILDLIETIDQEMVIGSRITVGLTESVTIRLT
jgi:hypothetical protein